MGYNPQVHHRQSIRLRGYDYSQPGMYFVTICTRERMEAFGEIQDGEMHLSSSGEIAHSIWSTMPKRFPNIELDLFVIMPNHMHGILVITAQSQGAMNCAPTSGMRNLTLGQMIRAYKAAVTRTIRYAGMPEFAWHRNYYEHIARLRKMNELDRIRQYILDNPARWAEDSLYGRN